jgi:hypothetical protein
MVLIIEQFLMLILIIGRWMLPKVRTHKYHGGFGFERIEQLPEFKASRRVPLYTLPVSAVQGDLTRDELAQLLLCYIGTAADIIEFFDSFKVLYTVKNKGKFGNFEYENIFKKKTPFILRSNIFAFLAYR